MRGGEVVRMSGQELGMYYGVVLWLACLCACVWSGNAQTHVLRQPHVDGRLDWIVESYSYDTQEPLSETTLLFPSASPNNIQRFVQEINRYYVVADGHLYIARGRESLGGSSSSEDSWGSATGDDSNWSGEDDSSLLQYQLRLSEASLPAVHSDDSNGTLVNLECSNRYYVVLWFQYDDGSVQAFAYQEHYPSALLYAITHVRPPLPSGSTQPTVSAMFYDRNPMFVHPRVREEEGSVVVDVLSTAFPHYPFVESSESFLYDSIAIDSCSVDHLEVTVPCLEADEHELFWSVCSRCGDDIRCQVRWMGLKRGLAIPASHRTLYEGNKMVSTCTKQNGGTYASPLLVNFEASDAEECSNEVAVDEAVSAVDNASPCHPILVFPLARMSVLFGKRRDLCGSAQEWGNACAPVSSTYKSVRCNDRNRCYGHGKCIEVPYSYLSSRVSQESLSVDSEPVDYPLSDLDERVDTPYTPPSPSPISPISDRSASGMPAPVSYRRDAPGASLPQFARDLLQSGISDRYMCECQDGYAGIFCQTRVPAMCGAGLCHLDNGRCIAGNCECFPGYSGRACENTAVMAFQHYVMEGEVVSDGSPVCMAKSGFVGVFQSERYSATYAFRLDGSGFVAVDEDISRCASFRDQKQVRMSQLTPQMSDMVLAADAAAVYPVCDDCLAFVVPGDNSFVVTDADVTKIMAVGLSRYEIFRITRFEVLEEEYTIEAPECCRDASLVCDIQCSVEQFTADNGHAASSTTSILQMFPSSPSDAEGMPGPAPATKVSDSSPSPPEAPLALPPMQMRPSTHSEASSDSLSQAASNSMPAAHQHTHSSEHSLWPSPSSSDDWIEDVVVVVVLFFVGVIGGLCGAAIVAVIQRAIKKTPSSDGYELGAF